MPYDFHDHADPGTLSTISQSGLPNHLQSPPGVAVNMQAQLFPEHRYTAADTYLALLRQVPLARFTNITGASVLLVAFQLPSGFSSPA